MADMSRPAPSLDDPDSAPFWRATKEHVLRYQRCDDCGTIVFFPRRHCTGCLGSALSWHTAAGEGQIYSFSVVRLSRHPFFRTQVPYAVALVDLDEGFRMLSNILASGDPGAVLTIGQRVLVEWEDHGELSFPVFRPG